MSKRSIPPEGDSVILVGRYTSPGFTKHITLGADGRLIKTSPVWQDGQYETLRLGSLEDWHAELLRAPAGAFYTSGVAAVDAARCMTKRTVEGDAIFRGIAHINPTPGMGLVVFDHDRGMTPREFDAAMTVVMPGWREIGIVRTMSTSTLITRDDGTIPDGVGTGHHTWLVVASQDFKLLQSIIMTRAWNAEYGHIHLSGDGRMLPRCLVDMAPLHPVQPVFESGAKLGRGLRQKRPHAAHRPGGILDISLLPPLTAAEVADYEGRLATARAEMQPRADARRKAWRSDAETRMEKRGVDKDRARATVEAATKARANLSGTLPAAWLLYPDEGDAVAVATVLASPGDYHRMTLADPLDGEGSDPRKAMVFFNQSSGDVMIHSFAHGGGVWQLVQDVDGLLEAVAAATAPDGWGIKRLEAEWLSLFNAADDVDELAIDRALKLLTKAGVGRVELLRKALKQRREAQQVARENATRAKTDDLRPIVVINPLKIRRTLRAIEDALIASPHEILTNNDRYIRVAKTRDKTQSGHDGGAPPVQLRFVEHDQTTIKLRIEDSVRLMADFGDGPKETKAPCWLLKDMLAKEDKRAPNVIRLVQHPLMRRDGSVRRTEGPDPETDMYLHFDGTTFPGVPADPTAKDVADAVAFIDEKLLSGYNYVDPLDRACAFAMLLTGLARPLLDIAPGFLVTAADQGSGKTTLCKATVLALTGADLAVRSGVDKSEEEWGKLLLAAVLDGMACLMVDNLEKDATFESAALASAITSGTYEGRLLGSTKTVSGKTRMLILLTGNNVRLGGDMPRRIVNVRITARDPTSGIDGETYLGIVRAERGAIVSAALTIIRASLVAGTERPLLMRSGFPAWDEMVRYPLYHAGLGDVGVVFANNIELDDDHAPAAASMAAMRALFDEIRFTSSDLTCVLAGEQDARVTALDARWPIDPANGDRSGEFRTLVATLRATLPDVVKNKKYAPKGAQGTAWAGHVLSALRSLEGSMKFDYVLRSANPQNVRVWWLEKKK